MTPDPPGLDALQDIFGHGTPPWSRAQLAAVLRQEDGNVDQACDRILQWKNQDPQTLVNQLHTASSSDGEVVWCWKEDTDRLHQHGAHRRVRGDFIRYDDYVAQELEASYQLDESGCTISIKGSSYKVDFVAMVQRNLQTGIARPIRRLEPAGPSSPVVVVAQPAIPSAPATGVPTIYHADGTPVVGGAAGSNSVHPPIAISGGSTTTPSTTIPSMTIPPTTAVPSITRPAPASVQTRSNRPSAALPVPTIPSVSSPLPSQPSNMIVQARQAFSGDPRKGLLSFPAGTLILVLPTTDTNGWLFGQLQSSVTTHPQSPSPLLQGWFPNQCLMDMQSPTVVQETRPPQTQPPPQPTISSSDIMQLYGKGPMTSMPEPPTMTMLSSSPAQNAPTENASARLAVGTAQPMPPPNTMPATTTFPATTTTKGHPAPAETIPTGPLPTAESLNSESRLNSTFPAPTATQRHTTPTETIPTCPLPNTESLNSEPRLPALSVPQVVSSPTTTPMELAATALSKLEQRLDELNSDKGTMKPIVVSELVTKVCCELDAVDTHGSIELRTKRKELIHKAERIDKDGHRGHSEQAASSKDLDIDHLPQHTDSDAQTNDCVVTTTSQAPLSRAVAPVKKDPSPARPSITTSDIMQMYAAKQPDVSKPTTMPTTSSSSTNSVDLLDLTTPSTIHPVNPNPQVEGSLVAPVPIQSLTQPVPPIPPLVAPPMPPLDPPPMPPLSESPSSSPFPTSPVAPPLMPPVAINKDISIVSVSENPSQTRMPPQSLSAPVDLLGLDTPNPQESVVVAPLAIQPNPLSPNPSSNAPAKHRPHPVVLAKFAFSGDPNQQQLSFPQGVEIRIYAGSEKQGWIQGKYGRQKGWFPVTYVQPKGSMLSSAVAPIQNTLIPLPVPGSENAISEFETQPIMGGAADHPNPSIATWNHCPWQSEQERIAALGNPSEPTPKDKPPVDKAKTKKKGKKKSKKIPKQNDNDAPVVVHEAEAEKSKGNPTTRKTTNAKKKKKKEKTKEAISPIPEKESLPQPNREPLQTLLTNSFTDSIDSSNDFGVMGEGKVDETFWQQQNSTTENLLTDTYAQETKKKVKHKRDASFKKKNLEPPTEKTPVTSKAHEKTLKKKKKQLSTRKIDADAKQAGSKKGKSKKGLQESQKKPRRKAGKEVTYDA